LEIKAIYESNYKTIIEFSADKLANNLDETQAGEYLITKEDITFIFVKLNSKLSSGIDGIPNIVLKNLPVVFMLEYCTLFNNMLNNSYFPNQWKTAKVIILPKKDKDTSNPKNLRPISLLPNISKVFEICINNNIMKHCQNKKLVSEKQFGFKHNHSCINAIQVLTSNINWNWNKKLFTGACLIDMEKAFDSVWIPGLIYKLFKYKFPLNQIIIIYNMISGKFFRVFHQNQQSSNSYKIINGLQQGTVNSPILFNLYLMDLLSKIDNIISFADDIIIYHAGNTIENINASLQEAYNVVENFTLDWNMKINVNKCETILFRPPLSKCNYNIKKNWKLFRIKSFRENKPIDNKDVVKYLGIHLDKFLYYNTHINEVLNKSRNAFFRYKSLFYSKHLNSRVKILMYQALVRPIITYGCPIWFNISPSYMERIRKFERKCLRACTSLFRNPQSHYTKYVSNEKLYKEANIIRIDNFIIELIRNYIKRCTSFKGNNLILAPYYTSEEYISNSLQTGFVPAEAFLYLDKIKLIQDQNGTPIFYHNFRRANKKTVIFTSSNNIRFNTNIGNSWVLTNKKRKNKKHWWLED